MRSTRGAGGKPIVVGGGTSVVATIAGAVEGAGASAAIVESVATDVVELAPTVRSEPTATGFESEPHAAAAQATATIMAMYRVTRVVMLSGTRSTPPANYGPHLLDEAG
jgi:hypothetical protein